MSVRLQYPTPSPGVAGVFKLKTPFTTLPRERCECIAVRKLSEYIANNEDPWTDVYQPAGLEQSEYEADLARDLEIVTLITAKGYRILVPVSYVEAYPIQDGIPYRGVGIYFALPPMPVQQNLDFLATSMKEVVKSQVGVTCTSEFVETTAIQMVTVDQHLTEQTNRKVVIGTDSTFAAQVSRLQNDLLDAQGKIRQLELYIMQNLGP